MLARMRFRLAVTTATELLGGEPESASFRDIIALLEHAEADIGNEEEAAAIRTHQLRIAREFINATYAAAGSAKRWDDMLLMLGTIDRLGDEEERTWARSELGAVCANLAVERLNRLHERRENFFRSIGRLS